MQGTTAEEHKDPWLSLSAMNKAIDLFAFLFPGPQNQVVNIREHISICRNTLKHSVRKEVCCIKKKTFVFSCVRNLFICQCSQPLAPEKLFFVSGPSAGASRAVLSGHRLPLPLGYVLPPPFCLNSLRCVWRKCRCTGVASQLKKSHVLLLIHYTDRFCTSPLFSRLNS